LVFVGAVTERAGVVGAAKATAAGFGNEDDIDSVCCTLALDAKENADEAVAAAPNAPPPLGAPGVLLELGVLEPNEKADVAVEPVEEAAVGGAAPLNENAGFALGTIPNGDGAVFALASGVDDAKENTLAGLAASGFVSTPELSVVLVEPNRLLPILPKEKEDVVGAFEFEPGNVNGGGAGFFAVLGGYAPGAGGGAAFFDVSGG